MEANFPDLVVSAAFASCYKLPALQLGGSAMKTIYPSSGILAEMHPAQFLPPPSSSFPDTKLRRGSPPRSRAVAAAAVALKAAVKHAAQR